jgi:histidine triad (HIT) family protein
MTLNSHEQREAHGCKFCIIAKHEAESNIVFEDDISVAFLDKRPVFLGHCLVIPIDHYETLNDLPGDLIGRFFTNVQLVSVAVEKGMNADGTFVAINNRVSQSVPHLHVHVVPRRAKDGLKGFFWPRRNYSGSEEEVRVRDALKKEIGVRMAQS